MANIAKIELGDTTYDIKDAVVRPKIDAITAEDTDGNTYVKTSQLTVDGNSNLNGTVTADTIAVQTQGGLSAFTIKSENLDRDTTQTIAETQWGSRIRFTDNNDESIGYIEPFQRPSGTTGLRIISWNEKSDESTAWNSLTLEVAKDGALSYSVSNPAAFRTAISAAEDKDYAYSTASQHPWFWNPGGSSQIWGVSATCQRSTNTSFYNKQVGLVVENTRLHCFNHTDNTAVWTAYTTAYRPTPADIGAQPAGSYVMTNADGAINTLASIPAHQWFVRGKINNSSSSINGHYTWLVMNDWGLSCWDATAQKTLWSADLIPTVVDLGTHGNIYRYGKMRIVKIDTDTAVNLNDSWTNRTLCTLPSQDRPMITTDGIAIAKNTGGLSVGLQIKEDGRVNVHAMGGAAPGNCTIWGQVVYLVA